ncbi:hypothetical protein ACU4GH_22840 [Bradyrhizobium betae]
MIVMSVVTALVLLALASRRPESSPCSAPFRRRGDGECRRRDASRVVGDTAPPAAEPGPARCGGADRDAARRELQFKAMRSVGDLVAKTIASSWSWIVWPWLEHARAARARDSTPPASGI